MTQRCNLSTAALGAIQKDEESKVTANCKSVKSDWRLDISGQYHDDATHIGNIEDLLLYFQESCKVYREYGMQYTHSKSELVINKNGKIDQLPKEF